MKTSEKGSFYSRICYVVRMVPAGRVATYKCIATKVATKDKFPPAQSVGNALKRAFMEGADVLWHRVVKANGKISPHAPKWQADILRKEGVEVEGSNGRFSVNLKKYSWCRE